MDQNCPDNSRLTPRRVDRNSIRSRRATFALAIGLAILPGCRRAAYNEFYVENMASEIRALEDRVYEYDSAYSALEIENEDLRQAIAEVRGKQRALQSGDWGGNSLLPPPVETIPKGTKSSKPNSSRGSVEIGPSDLPGEEIDLSPRSNPPRKTPPPKASVPEKAPAPKSPAPAVEPTEELPLPPSLPPANSSAFPKSNAPGLNKPPSASELDLDFEIPQGTIHSTLEPKANGGASNGAKKPNSKQIALPRLTSESIREGRIQLPLDNLVVPASAQTPAPKPKVIDTKLVEIGFHDTLCRGHNFDETPGDDGLYLVVTPRNSEGEVLNQLGKLTIVVEETQGDLSRRIAAWEVTPQELQESLEPIGVSQGFHLSLPWEENVPEGNQVQVFLKYVLEDGRSLVNRKDIQLRKPGSRQTTWTPR